MSDVAALEASAGGPSGNTTVSEGNKGRVLWLSVPMHLPGAGLDRSTMIEVKPRPSRRWPHPGWLALILLLLSTVGVYLVYGLAYYRQNKFIADLRRRGVSVNKEFNPSRPPAPIIPPIFQVDGKNLTESDLARLASEPFLERLDLNQVSITPAGLRMIGRMRSLQSLGLRNVTLPDEPIDWTALPNLQVLSVRETSLTPAHFAQIGRSRSIDFLSLEDAGLTDDSLASFAGMGQLKILFLKDNDITDAGLSSLSQLTHLKLLNLSGTAVTGESFTVLQPLSKLTWLSLMETPLTAEGLAAVVKLPALSSLSLSKTAITDDNLEHLAGMPHLDQLFLSGANITDAAVPHLRRLRLASLNISHTKITDGGLLQLAEIKSLRAIDVSGTATSIQTDQELARRLPGCTVSRDGSFSRIGGYLPLEPDLP